MTFLDLVNQRQSCRAYLEQPVEREKLERCLEAARLAPSACNSQPWHFIVVDEPDLRRAVAQETFGQIVSFNHFTMDGPGPNSNRRRTPRPLRQDRRPGQTETLPSLRHRHRRRTPLPSSYGGRPGQLHVGLVQ